MIDLTYNAADQSLHWQTPAVSNLYGYRLLKNGSGVSVSYDAAKTSWKIGTPATTDVFKLVALGNEAQGIYPPVVTPPPPAAWPAAFFSGPSGAKNPLPPKQGCWWMPSYGGPGMTWDKIKTRLASQESYCGRKFDAVHLFNSSPSGGCSYPDDPPFGLGREQWLVDQGYATQMKSYYPGFSILETKAGKADACWTDFAKKAAAFGHPFFLRLWQEYNLPGMPLMAGGATGADFIAAWRHVVGILAANGANNVALVWCPHEGYYNAAHRDAFYPGDPYVDVVSSDEYSGTTSDWCACEYVQWPVQKFCPFKCHFHSSSGTAPYGGVGTGASPCRDFESPTAYSQGKPYLVGETGVSSTITDPGRATWLTQALADIKADFTKNLVAVSYFDQDVSSLEGAKANWLLDAGAVSMMPSLKTLVRDPYFNPRGLPLS